MQLGAQELLFLINKLQIAKERPGGFSQATTQILGLRPQPFANRESGKGAILVVKVIRISRAEEKRSG